MKVTDVYDKHLAAIKEAERKVRIAKRRLLEAERELDETLELAESELKFDENSVALQELTRNQIGYLWIAYKNGDANKTPIRDSEGKIISLVYNANLDKDEIKNREKNKKAFIDMLHEKGWKDETIKKLCIRRVKEADLQD